MASTCQHLNSDVNNAMVQLPRLELKAERDELIRLICMPFNRDPDFLRTKDSMTAFVYRMGNRNVLDCLAVMKG